jgi:hypothetical protein
MRLIHNQKVYKLNEKSISISIINGRVTIRKATLKSIESVKAKVIPSTIKEGINS